MRIDEKNEHSISDNPKKQGDDYQGNGISNFVGRLVLRPKEVSSATGLSLPLIYRLLRLGSNGGIRNFRVNNSILIPLETLKEDLVNLTGKEIKV